MVASYQEARCHGPDEQWLGCDDLRFCLAHARICGEAAYIHLPGGERVWQRHGHLPAPFRVGDECRIPISSIREILAEDGWGITASTTAPTWLKIVTPTITSQRQSCLHAKGLVAIEGRQNIF